MNLYAFHRLDPETESADTHGRLRASASFRAAGDFGSVYAMVRAYLQSLDQRAKAEINLAAESGDRQVFFRLETLEKYF